MAVVEANSTRLPLKGPLRRTRPRSLIRLADTVDDDGIVVKNFQQLLGFRLAISSHMKFASDRKSLEIKRLEMVDQTVASWNRIEAWLRHISGLREAA
jgi:hypothetical protein